MTRTVMPDCPHCHGGSVVTINRGRKSAVMLGGLAGGISSAATVWNGARIGAAVGAIAGPTGSLLSAVAGAVLAALAGGAAGCAAGAVVGDLIDDKVLNNYRCLDCGHRFSRLSTKDVMAGQPQTPRESPHPATPHSANHSSHQPHHSHAHGPSPFGPSFLQEDLDDEHPYGFYGPYPHPHHASPHG